MDTTWQLLDSAGRGQPEFISFDVKMANGKSLLDHAELLATAKELVFWIRASSYTRIDDASRHKLYAETTLRLCYGLTARGFNSFSELNFGDVDQICEHAAFGVDGLTWASVLARRFLDRYTTWDQVPVEIAPNGVFELNAVIDFFNLPQKYARKQIGAEVKFASARINGNILHDASVENRKTLTSLYIGIVTNLFDALFTLRNYMCAPTLTFRPFVEGPAKRAMELGVTSIRTPIPPKELTLKFMEEATRFLVNDGEAIVDAYRDLIKRRNQVNWREEGGWRILANDVRRNVIDLMTALYVLVATFTARRKQEIKILPRDCLRRDDQQGWMLKVYIEKTTREWTWIPIPNFLARTIELVKSLTPLVEETGSETELDLLFQWYDPILCRAVSPNIEGRLNRLASRLDAFQHLSDNGETLPWHWQTRQFRRFFAVMFLYIYKGQLQTLAHHLRHFNTETTKGYAVLDPSAAKEWTRELFDFQVNLARDIVSGRMSYTGPMGERLTQLAESVKRAFHEKVAIYTDLVAMALVRSMKEQKLVLTPKAWVTCTCPSNRSGCKKASCRKISGFEANDIGPNFAAAGPSVCPQCPWALFANENRQFFDQEIDALEGGLMVETESTIFAELQSENVISLKKYRVSIEPAIESGQKK